MIEYTVIGNFNYKGNKYELLVDDNNRYFFLKINNNNYEYVTLKELVELSRVFAPKGCALCVEYNRNDKKNRKRIVPKVIIGTVAVAMSLSLASVLSGYNRLYNDAKFDLNNYEYTENISYTEDNYDYDETQEAINQYLEEVRMELERDNDVAMEEGIRLKIVYDSSALDDVLGYPKEAVTYDTIRETIRNNSNIPDKFKELYITLANNLESQYPTMDLRIWYENLKNLKILEVDEMEMKIKAINAEAYAVYRLDENAIYTVKGYNYVPGTWDYQTIMHEMCHPIRGGRFKIGDIDVAVYFTTPYGNGAIIEEAMNSLLAVRSYDQNERDIAYQLQSNIVELLVDSLDNYTYQDFIEHNLTYFEDRLNERSGDNKAMEMIGLIELQYKDYHDDDIKVDQSMYLPLYDYIARLYYMKYLTPNMSYEEALKIYQIFIDKLTYDVPTEYELNIPHMQEYFNTYCTEIGIHHENTK